MKPLRTARVISASCLLITSACLLPKTFALPRTMQQSQESAPSNAVVRRIGTIKSITGNSITLMPDTGTELTVTVQDSTRLMRIAPGEANLKNATSIQLQDLQVGDRILVGGKSSHDPKSIVASSVVVMKRTDVEARQQQELQDWQKRGIGGLVNGIDSSSGTVTTTITGLGSSRSVAIHTTKSTIIRRYAPDSVKFDDAKLSSLAEIHPGDQLRARGNRSTDGAELAADEIVTGTFRNLAGIINFVDANSGIVNVQDLLSRKPAQVKITHDSQLRKLPPEIAQRVAARFKTGAAGVSASGASGATPNDKNPAAPTPGASEPGTMRMRSGGNADLQQLLNRMPTITLSDLHKGDAVMIVATQAENAAAGTAITLLSGVELILQAAPTAGQAMMISPWSLGGPPSGDGNQ